MKKFKFFVEVHTMNCGIKYIEQIIIELKSIDKNKAIEIINNYLDKAYPKTNREELYINEISEFPVVKL